MQKNSVQVGPVTAQPGAKVWGRLPVGELAYGSEVALPIMILNGESEGPVLWINGAVHGDELNGPVAARNVFLRLDPSEVKGTVIVSPIANVLAFQARRKISNLDYLNLDTLFPGNPKGLFSERIAYVLFENIRRTATHLLSFHTVGTPYQAAPYTVYKIVKDAQQSVTRMVEEMARAFGVETNCRVDLATATGELPGTTLGALDIECIKRGIPAFMAEAGGGGRLEDDNIAVAERGVVNLMRFLGMLPGAVDRPEQQVVIHERFYIRSDFGGLVRMIVHPGQIVRSGEPIAEVFDFAGNARTLTAGQDIYVILTRINPVVETGARLAFVASRWGVMNGSS